MTNQPAATPEVVGFDQATRHNIRNIDGATYSPNGQSFITLPKAGLGSKLHLLVKGTVNAQHATVTSLSGSDYGPYNIIKRLRLVLNNGLVLLDVSGYGLHILNLKRRLNMRSDQSGDSQVFAFEKVSSSGGTDNAFRFYLELPIAFNDRDNLGYIMLQNPETQARIEIDWDNAAANTGPYTDIEQSGMTASASISALLAEEFFSVPTDRRNLPPLNYVSTIMEDQQAISAVGDQSYGVPRGNTITGLTFWHHHNGVLAPSSDVSNVSLAYNQAETPYTVDADILRAINRDMYGRDIPKGTWILDYNHQGIPNLGTSRDYINTGLITDLVLKSTVTSDATLGSGTNYLRVLREQLVEIRQV